MYTEFADYAQIMHTFYASPFYITVLMFVHLPTARSVRCSLS